MPDTFTPPGRRRDVPTLAELEGYLIAIEPFEIKTIPASWLSNGYVERLECRVIVCAPPVGDSYMAVHVNGANHLVPAAFGTRELPMYVTSLRIIEACKGAWVGSTCVPLGRLYQERQGVRRWWTLARATATERLIGQAVLAELGGQ